MFSEICWLYVFLNNSDITIIIKIIIVNVLLLYYYIKKYFFLLPKNLYELFGIEMFNDALILNNYNILTNLNLNYNAVQKNNFAS